MTTITDSDGTWEIEKVTKEGVVIRNLKAPSLNFIASRPVFVEEKPKTIEEKIEQILKAKGLI